MMGNTFIRFISTKQMQDTEGILHKDIQVQARNCRDILTSQIFRVILGFIGILFTSFSVNTIIFDILILPFVQNTIISDFLI